MNKPRICFLLAVCLVATIFSCFSIFKPLVNTNSIIIEDVDKDAYKTLSTTQVFAVDANYAGDSTFRAFRTLFESKNAKNYFLKLENEGTNEAKLYAFCGLYFLDHYHYGERIRKYLSSDETVNYVFGCMWGTFEIKELIKSSEPNALRLKYEGDDVNRWTQRLSSDPGICDFYGGGFPSFLLNYIYS